MAGEKRAARVFDQKLRNKMLVRVLVTATLILLTLASVTFLVTRSLLHRELEEKSRSRVDQAATVIDAWLRERGQVLAILADRESRDPMDEARKPAYFRDVARRWGGFESVYMGFEDGRFITGSDWVPPADYVPADRPWYQAATAAGDVAYSAPYRDLHTGRIVVSVAAPVDRAGVRTGVMAMDLFVDDILGVVHDLEVGDSGYAYMVDHTGTFVAHPDPTQVLEGNAGDTADARYLAAYQAEPGATGSRIYEGDDYVTVSRIPAIDWHLVFHLPPSVVDRPLRTLALIFLIGICAALTVLAFTISYISNKIARPLLHLVDGAQDISRGEYARRLPVESRDEIGYLTQSFNEMAEGLADRDFIKSTFGRYVSPDVMREILAGNIAMGGEAKLLSVMFSDIRGFTTLSEGMDPHQLVTMLNAYFTLMDGAISAQGGSINKYLGDGILAIFGAPVPLADSAGAAVRAAHAMLEALAEFNQRFDRALAVGVGIHTGEAVVGNIGSEQRTEYTVIGDSVNLASRIESLTKRYEQPILVSEETALRLGDGYLLRMIDRVRVKGKNTPVNLIRPLLERELSPAEAERIERCNLAMERYLRGDFAGALEVIDGLTGHLDAHLRIIQKRCRRLHATPPVDWDGVSILDAK